MLVFWVNLLFLIMSNVSIMTDNKVNNIFPKGIWMYNCNKIDEMANYIKLKTTLLLEQKILYFWNLFSNQCSKNKKIKNIKTTPLKVMLDDFSGHIYK